MLQATVASSHLLQAVLDSSRDDSKKAVFLVTDGFSNYGSPVRAASQLRAAGAELFTFGIKNGNPTELLEIASQPKTQHTYILDSFEEFESLARRALHEGSSEGGGG